MHERMNYLGGPQNLLTANAISTSFNAAATYEVDITSEESIQLNLHLNMIKETPLSPSQPSELVRIFRGEMFFQVYC
jgi:hypothetical protein